MSAFPVTFTEQGIARVRFVLLKEGKPMLRVGVKGGGCSGFEYVLRGVTEAMEGDLRETFEGLDVVCDPKSAAILAGTTIDYTGSLLGGFSFDNPNAAKTCGCGTSFSLKPKPQ